MVSKIPARRNFFSSVRQWRVIPPVALSQTLSNRNYGSLVETLLNIGKEKRSYHPLFSSLKVEDLLKETEYGSSIALDMFGVSGGDPVVSAMKKMSSKNIGCSVVTEKIDARSQQVIGILTERDYIQKVVLPKQDEDKTTCSEVMTHNPKCVNPQTPLDECIDTMLHERFRHLPVVLWDDKNPKPTPTYQLIDLVGLLSVKMLVRYARKVLQSDHKASQELSKISVQKLIPRNHPPKMIEMTEPIIQALTIMGRNNIGSLLVTNHGNVVGIVTERDFIQKVVGADLVASDKLTVAEIMTPNPKSISANQKLSTLLDLFVELGVRHMPIRANEDSKSPYIAMMGIRQALNVCRILEADPNTVVQNDNVEPTG